MLSRLASRTLGQAGAAAARHARAPAAFVASQSIGARSMATQDKWSKTAEDRERVLDTFAIASIDGGFEIVEFTLTTPDCLKHMADFRAKHDGKVMIGCGTAMDVNDVKACLEAGAEFIVAPVLVEEVVRFCAERNVVIIPGCNTPTELFQAHTYGAPIQKLFPGVAGGANFVKAVSAALPMLNINPTSGVDLDNAGEFLKSGAASVGLVAPLFDPALIAKGDWDGIAANAQKVIGNVKPVGPYNRKK